jgi:TetR/AcrR family transcriptional repressor of nem operon
VRINEDGRLAARDKIIVAAAGLIAKKGPARATLDDVRRAAGATPAQLREHFVDRTAVLAGVCAAAPGIVPESPTDRAVSEHDSIEGLRGWAELYMDQFQRDDFRDACVLSALAGPLAATEPAARTDLGIGLRRWMTAPERGLQAMRERGELSSDTDPDVPASSLLSILLGGILIAKTTRDIAPLRYAIATMIAQVPSRACAGTSGSPAGLLTKLAAAALASHTWGISHGSRPA